ncbi:MAG: KEOPS complex subunit Cgi121 [Candidatus Thorarchaeota archaeon]
MAPLIVQEVTVGSSHHQVGIFGCSLTRPLLPEAIIDLTKQITFTPGLTFLLVDADYVAGTDHLLFATIHAFSAFNTQTNRASTRQMEILRFAAAQRQISQALEILGISNSTRRLGGVLANTKESALDSAYHKFLQLTEATDDPAVLEIDTDKKAQAIQDNFDISAAELEAICPSKKSVARKQALQKLVFDRCALLAITR